MGTDRVARLRVDRNGIVLTWNTESERLLGYRADEMVGKSLSVIVPRAFQERHWAGFNRFVATGQSRLPEEAVSPALCKNGETLLIAISVQPVRDTSGEIVGVDARMRAA